jgi:hypothetical protein
VRLELRFARVRMLPSREAEEVAGAPPDDHPRDRTRTAPRTETGSSGS